MFEKYSKRKVAINLKPDIIVKQLYVIIKLLLAKCEHLEVIDFLSISRFK